MCLCTFDMCLVHHVTCETLRILEGCGVVVAAGEKHLSKVVVLSLSNAAGEND